MKVFAVYWLAVAMALATTTARPQEYTQQQEQPNVEEILQQAQYNAGGGFFPPIPGNEGFYNHNAGNGYGPEFGGQETHNFFGPEAGTMNGDGSPQESQGELSSFSSPTREESPVFPDYGISPIESTEGKVPTETLVPTQDNKPLTADSSLPYSPFAVDQVPNFPAFGQFGGNGATQSQNLIQGLWGMLNNAQNGNATAGGAGSGTVQNGTATGQGTGIANVGFGGFGIGLGIGGAIQTPLGNLAFGQGNGVAVGR